MTEARHATNIYDLAVYLRDTKEGEGFTSSRALLAQIILVVEAADRLLEKPYSIWRWLYLYKMVLRVKGELE